MNSLLELFGVSPEFAAAFWLPLLAYTAWTVKLSATHLNTPSNIRWLQWAVIGSICWTLTTPIAWYWMDLSYSQFSFHSMEPSRAAVWWLFLGWVTLWLPVGFSRCFENETRFYAMRTSAAAIAFGVVGGGVGLIGGYVVASVVLHPGSDDIGAGLAVLGIAVVAGLIGLAVGLILGAMAGRGPRYGSDPVMRSRGFDVKVDDPS